ncbi:uncharacterized protein SRS1_14418 [Sporisorium reilianum f. sp. reilianum]|uniref:WW domain-containing protein n=1 Tax=Sporisorium reilianum f. sp. reilianum TaxID=72559 RepID=A0A2N8UFY1_9BASI|nr:uncharacterized protein SRS1_14418 [Sporisorium reilianum f. sp. reilianum]
MGDTTHSIGPSSHLLPPGWTSHTSPAGRTYYHNASSGVSTYTFPRLKPPKREKPTAKTLIPNTSGWLKVTTNRDNVFYFHPESKTSQWLPPPHVAAALKQLEEDEVREKERKRKEEEDRIREEREKARRERLERKRKLEEGVPITEFDSSKRARADEEDEEEEEDCKSEEAEDDDNDEDEPTASHVNGDDASADALQDDTVEAANDDDDDDDDQEWQCQIAEQMAAEAEAEAQSSAPESTHPPPPDPPLTLEDAKSSFTAHLTSLNNTPHEINPMAPWDLEQSKFSSHASYLALPTRDREDAFNEWCKLRIREKRAAKAASSSTSKTSHRDPFSASAQSALLTLLRDEVRSTRTKFSDFAAAFAHDARYTAYGRTDTDREALFRTHLVELGEQKRAAAQRAEAAFLDLLSDRLPGNYRDRVAAAVGKDKVMEVWMEAKRSAGLVEDGRYEAVGSSTRRFELFGVWASGERRRADGAKPAATSSGAAVEDAAAAKAKAKQAQRTQALREREQQVRLERQRIERANRTALSAATREESLLSFRQLLLDAVHTAHTSYTAATALLSRDPRFDAPALTASDKQQLYAEHQAQLAAKEDSRLASVFARYAPRLDTHAEDVLARTLEDDALTRPPLLGFAQDRRRLEDAYARWSAQREVEAQRAFSAMLRESAFVEFWGRLKKQASSTTSSSQDKGAEEDEEDGEEATTLVEMARRVDLAEIEAVLRNDARFRAFQHAPEQRRTWIREHLHSLAAPANSVHR